MKKTVKKLPHQSLKSYSKSDEKTTEPSSSMMLGAIHEGRRSAHVHIHKLDGSKDYPQNHGTLARHFGPTCSNIAWFGSHSANGRALRLRWGRGGCFGWVSIHPGAPAGAFRHLFFLKMHFTPLWPGLEANAESVDAGAGRTGVRARGPEQVPFTHDLSVQESVKIGPRRWEERRAWPARCLASCFFQCPLVMLQKSTAIRGRERK